MCPFLIKRCQGYLCANNHTRYIGAPSEDVANSSPQTVFYSCFYSLLQSFPQMYFPTLYFARCNMLNASQRTSDNNVQKELAKAGSSAGQTKITDPFFATSSCGRGVHGGNTANNVSVRSPNAKDVDTNDNLNTGDGIANSENNMGFNFARSTCDASVSISRNTSGSN